MLSSKGNERFFQMFFSLIPLQYLVSEISSRVRVLKMDALRKKGNHFIHHLQCFILHRDQKATTAGSI